MNLNKPFSMRAILTAKELDRILKAKDISDWTCFLNVGLWMDEVCKDAAEFKSLSEIIFALAKEAAAPSSRNRAAVFMSLMKSQLGYMPPSRQEKPYEKLKRVSTELFKAPSRGKSVSEKVQEQIRLLGVQR
jgi:hypothetical protein